VQREGAAGALEATAAARRHLTLIMGREMQKPSRLEAEAHTKRGAAARVRRLARGLSQPEDQERLEQFAKELDTQAIQLEAQVAALRSKSH
jgi:hypothetical protein